MTRSHDNARSGVNECQLGPTVSNDGNRLLGNKRRRARDAPFSMLPSTKVLLGKQEREREKGLRELALQALLQLRTLTRIPGRITPQQSIKIIFEAALTQVVEKKRILFRYIFNLVQHSGYNVRNIMWR